MKPKIPEFGNLPPELKSAINISNYEQVLCPPKELLFRAFYQHPLEDTKIVIIGSEPYTEPLAANGLAFGIGKGYGPGLSFVHPSSLLLNAVKKETESLNTDVSLLPWAKQGVLLLNLRLSGMVNQPGAHKDLGWEQLMVDFLKELDYYRKSKVYLLWGPEARALDSELDHKTNLVLCSDQPSGFNLANDYLERRGRTPIIW